MARIRTIKPELPHSETLGSVSREARLLFINLFTIADDAGRGRATSRLLASLLYPYDDDAGHLIDGWMSELKGVGAVRLYTVNGVDYFDIPKWLDHQKIDKPSTSRLPAFSDEFAKPLETSPLYLGPSTSDLVSTPIAPKGAGYSVEFEKFWEAYPNKTAKDTAWRAWRKRKDRPTLELILQALDRYVRTKPSDINWKNPATWINGGCWNDAPANSPGTTPEAPTASGRPDFAWRNAVKAYLERKYWPSNFGPKPDQPSCECPLPILIELGFRQPLQATG